MYLTKKDFGRLSYCVKLLYGKYGRCISLYPDQEEMVSLAMETIIALEKKRDRDNARQVAYINNKRKSDPKYFRSRKRLEQAVRDVLESDMEVVFDDTIDIEEALKNASDHELVEFLKRVKE